VVEIIKRKIESTKTVINAEYPNEVQVALNDWGHLTVRIFDPKNPNEDTLIVFDKTVTYRIIKFIMNLMSEASEHNCEC